jgi:MFS family permease
MSAVRNYVLVTIAYWAFTLTDGALRMLVLLHFHALGYTPVELAFLFVLYELFGVVTNLLGGWMASRMGLRVTLLGGLALQVVSLVALGWVAPGWSKAASVAYVMGAQSLSGIAKDLTKMSAKSTIKLLVPENKASSLFKWVAILTGSKNALKGVGFFLGGLLLALMGYRHALFGMAAGLLVVLAASALSLPRELGKSKAKSKFNGLLSKTRDVNVLSAARFFLFGARDIWFVVGVPVFLSVNLGWGFTEVGTFLALWVIGYGIVQSGAPILIRRWTAGRAPQGRTAQVLAFGLAGVTAARRGRAGRGARACRGDRGGARGLWLRLCHQLVGPLVLDPRVLGRGQGRDERRLLLHGERRRSARGYAALGRHVSGRRGDRLPVGVDDVCGCVRRGRVAAAQEGHAAHERDEGRGGRLNRAPSVVRAQAQSPRPSRRYRCKCGQSRRLALPWNAA